MPSFLSKVFGRKKDDKESTTASSAQKRSLSLLEGKYEDISPTVSPTAANFADTVYQGKEKENGLSLALFRSRSRNPEAAGSRQSNHTPAPAPHLTLNLPVPKEDKNRLLGVVFGADPDGGGDVSSKDIAECRLSPTEALNLVKTCFDIIVSRGGLETLGIMHPHWHSASHETQQKLLTLFILSLPSRKATSTPPVSFNTELDYTRTLHDIAAVLRWGLRHVRLENSNFGLTSTNGAFEWEWYASFAQKEREAAYPTTAFTKSLAPLLPPAHAQLLTKILDIISSLAAHVDATGTSGSKLVKMFGLWLLASDRAKAGEQWQAFYNRWDTAGRVLEHLFLAYVREEDSKNKMPLRLSELVKQYPYYGTQEASTAGIDPQDSLPFLPRPRFSTRLYDALFIRIDTRLPSTKYTRPSKSVPIRFLLDALKCTTADDASSSEEAVKIWQELKKVASTEDKDAKEAGVEYPELVRILDDETLRLFSFIPEPQTKPSTSTTSPAVATSAITSESQHRRSSSLGVTLASIDNTKKTAATNENEAGNGASTSPTSPSLTSWADFSMSGFGETSIGKDFASGLLENDVESTSPQLTIPFDTKKRRASSPGQGRGRIAQPSPLKFTSGENEKDVKLENKLVQLNVIQVDEAFFDFWSDALLDPIASDWPQFIVCHLKPSTFPVNVLVIEHSYSYPPPPVEQTGSDATSSKAPADVPKRRRASSPASNLSASGRKSSTFSPIKKRFSFFASVGSKTSSPVPTSTGADEAKSSKSPKIGEMGEVLAEVDEPTPTITKKDKPLSESPKEQAKELGSAVAATATAGTAAEVATSVLPKSDNVPEPTPAAELPAVPVIDVTPPTATLTTEFAPVATEPLNTNEDAEKPIPHSAVSPSEAEVPADAPEGGKPEKGPGKSLPPAPEPVVLSGATPGPQVALESSEPAALAEVAAAATDKPSPHEPGAIQAQSQEGSSPGHEALPDVSTLPELVTAAAVDEDTEEVYEDTVEVYEELNPSTADLDVGLPADTSPDVSLPTHKVEVAAEPEVRPQEETSSGHGDEKEPTVTQPSEDAAKDGSP